MSSRAMDFEGQSVIVTCGATGIGEACCRQFAKAGAKVAVVDIDRDGAERVADAIGRDGGAACTSIVN